MKATIPAALAASLALAAAGALADTTRTEKSKAEMQQKASPSAQKSDEERAEASQGQPDVPASSGGSTAPGTVTEGPAAGASLPATSEPPAPPPAKASAGDAYQSNENKADSTKK